MKKILVLVSLLATYAVAEVSREKQTELQVQQTEKRMRVVHHRIGELEGLMTSLMDQRSNFAGYGIPRGQADITRVRQELYKARAEYGELAARKLYLNQSLQQAKAPKRNVSGANGESVDPRPTNAPQDCEHGVVKMGNQWHCILKQSSNSVPTEEPQKDEDKFAHCELGTFESEGETYCLGNEPGGPMRAKMSLEFLGTLMDEDPDFEEPEDISPDVYKQMRME